jgi:hypothetical protein
MAVGLSTEIEQAPFIEARRFFCLKNEFLKNGDALRSFDSVVSAVVGKMPLRAGSSGMQIGIAMLFLAWLRL